MIMGLPDIGGRNISWLMTNHILDIITMTYGLNTIISDSPRELHSARLGVHATIPYITRTALTAGNCALIAVFDGASYAPL